MWATKAMAMLDNLKGCHRHAHLLYSILGFPLFLDGVGYPLCPHQVCLDVLSALCMQEGARGLVCRMGLVLSWV